LRVGCFKPARKSGCKTLGASGGQTVRQMINYFDIITIALTIAVDYLIYRHLRLQKFYFIIALLVAFIFFYVVPNISATIELKKNAIEYPDSDGFNNFYIALKWPIWWFLGICEIVGLFLIIKTNKKINADKTVT
jgi:hypothetical protein